MLKLCERRSLHNYEHVPTVRKNREYILRHLKTKIKNNKIIDTSVLAVSKNKDYIGIYFVAL